jgi:multiple sugar transport system permease protein
MAAVVLASVWKVMPLVMLVVLASLQSIPSELYEATRMDGAGALETFKAVTWPHIAPTVREYFAHDDLVHPPFRDHLSPDRRRPRRHTNTLVVNVYRQAFSNQELGRAAAIGALGLVLSLLVTVVYFMMERRNAAKEA